MLKSTRELRLEAVIADLLKLVADLEGHRAENTYTIEDMESHAAVIEARKALAREATHRAPAVIEWPPICG